MEELLELSEGLPERVLAPDEALIVEGEAPDHLYVLVEGAVVVRRDGDDVVRLDQPGACIGEKAILLGRPHRSSVVAVAPSRVRVFEDAADRLRRRTPRSCTAWPCCSPARLDMAEAFVSDLSHQYRDHEAAWAWSARSSAARPPPRRRRQPAGRERDPDPLY